MRLSTNVQVIGMGVG